MSREMVRVMLRLPKSLKKKMDAEKKDWSAIAQQAIEAQLENSSSQPLPPDAPLLERLRQSRDEYEASIFAEGQEAGREWVSHGNFAQLRRFERLWDGTEDKQVLWCTTDGDAYSASHHFFFAIEPSLSGEWREAQAFWEVLLGDDCEQDKEDEFMRGFMSAAIEEWAELQRQL